MNYEDDNMVPVDGHKTEHKDEDTKMVMRQLKHLEKNACALLETFRALCGTPSHRGLAQKKDHPC